MMGLLEKVKELGLDWPAVPAAVGSYVPACACGNLIFTSGQLPLKNGVLSASGKVPTVVPLDLAQAAASQAVLNCLAAAASVAGGHDNIARIVRMNVFVNSAAGFVDQAKVANGASDLLIKLFGQAGQHTRCAVGAMELPLNAPVEIDLVVERK
jgi:enamine deaminase RidA (YjgF/YER057c/UK114 family)